MVGFYIGDECAIFVATLGGLRVEPYRSAEVNIVDVVRTAYYYGGAFSLSSKANYFGMTRFTEDNHLTINGPHLIVPSTDTLLECKYYRTSGINEVNTQTPSSTICLGRLTMGSNKHLTAAKSFQPTMVYHLKSFTAQSVHLCTIVDNITQTIEPTVTSKCLLGSADGFHHAKTIACIIVDSHLHNGPLTHALVHLTGRLDYLLVFLRCKIA